MARVQTLVNYAACCYTFYVFHKSDNNCFQMFFSQCWMCGSYEQTDILDYNCCFFNYSCFAVVTNSIYINKG